MGELILHKAGLYTSVQDMGRHGYRKYGVPLSGAMDQHSARLANLLVNNPEDAPLLEITLQGPEITFSKPTCIAITGADLSARLDESPLLLNAVIQVAAGQRLTFGQPKMGARAYLALAGGLEGQKVLGSHSQYAGITPTAQLKNGDRILYQPLQSRTETYARVATDGDHFTTQRLSVIRGPEFHLLEAPMQQMLLENEWSIGANSRMGYQLSNERFPPHQLQIITSPVVPGTIQLTPSGQLMALMRDAQVTGGYPRVLQLTEVSINQLAQKRTGGRLRLVVSSF